MPVPSVTVLQRYTACASYTYDDCVEYSLSSSPQCLVLESGYMGLDLDECEEQEDNDVKLGESSDSEDEDEDETDSKGRKDKDAGKERTLHEKMMDLMTLQTASGHFAENKMIGDIIGKPLEDLKAQVPDSNPDSMKSWITAIVVAFLELRCLEEKDLWQMSVNKARATILDLGSIEKAKEIIAQF